MFEIRKLKATDKTQWLSLWQGYLDFYQTEMPMQAIDYTWQRLVTPDAGKAGKLTGFAVFKDDKLVAFAHITLHEHSWTFEPCCYLIDLFVAPACRKQGIARQLFDYLYDYVKKNNYARVYWLSKEDNHTARLLYDKIAKKTDFVQYRHDIF
ncbi:MULTISPECIES: GNAT family N-acetyltransferase [unclassified Acinetobacter]|uniref:GNAT family N-acetyltransferase n=1 Tax=unclassified Acinetobacter TaxID=196816 RepID=UPI0035BA9EF3